MTTVTLATSFFFWQRCLPFTSICGVFIQETCLCGCIAIYLVIGLLTSGPVIHLKCSVTDGNRSSARHCPVFVMVVVLFDTKVQIIINSSYPSYLFSHPTHRTFFTCAHPLPMLLLLLLPVDPAIDCPHTLTHTYTHAASHHPIQSAPLIDCH